VESKVVGSQQHLIRLVKDFLLVSIDKRGSEVGSEYLCERVGF